MSDPETHQTINRAQNEVLRTRILRVAETVYPRWTSRAVLFRVLDDGHVDTSLNKLDFNAHYLAEKGFLSMEKEGKGRDAGWRMKITARGIDFLEGRIEEVGLASPDLVE